MATQEFGVFPQPMSISSEDISDDFPLENSIKPEEKYLNINYENDPFGFYSEFRHLKTRGWYEHEGFFSLSSNPTVSPRSPSRSRSPTRSQSRSQSRSPSPRRQVYYPRSPTYDTIRPDSCYGLKNVTERNKKIFVDHYVCLDGRTAYWRKPHLGSVFGREIYLDGQYIRYGK